MRPATSIRPRFLAALCAACAAAWTCPFARADLIRLADGGYRAGRIVEETPAQIRLKSGTPWAPEEVTLPKSKIARIYRTLDEAQEIDRATDPARLRAWAAAYFHAEALSSATQCIRRAWGLRPAIGDRPLAEGSAEFRAFWNRIVLRQRDAALPTRSAAEILTLARWAHDAGLEEEAARYLRNAWSHDRASTAVRTLADAWDVEIESWVRIDLAAALHSPLFAAGIQDEGTRVAAGAGKQFLTLPLRYDPDAGPRVLSRTLLDGKDRRAFYGLRVLAEAPDGQGLGSVHAEPVYERMELRARGDARPQLVVKNNLGPRTTQDETRTQERLKTQGEIVRASGWLLLILETGRRTRQITLHWGDGGFEALDLAYLRGVGRPLLEPERRDPDGPDIAASLRQVTGNSGATAALALRQLAGVRDRLQPEKRAAWSQRIDPEIVAAGARLEWQVRGAAWAYFARQDALSAAARRSMREAGARVQAAWIDTVRAFARNEPDHPVAMQLLCAILHSDEEEICRRAMDVLTSLGREIDWDRVAEASETARLAALARIDRLPREQAARMLIALMRSVTLSSADRIARYAQSLDLNLIDPRDPILTQWSSLGRPADRRALLTVLRSVDLGDLIYSRSFDTMIREAMRQTSRADLREAAYAAVVEQVRRRQARLDTPGAGRVQTAFPLLLSLDAGDPVLSGLTEAAASRSHDTRIEALAMLLKEGFAEQAEQGVLAAARTPSDVDRLLGELIARKDIAECNALLALLGRFLKPPHAGSARRIFSHLNEVVARSPATQRWRILAAVKAGVNMKNLDELVRSLRPARAVTARRWQYQLGHLTPQDRQRLAASRDPDERLRKLRRIDLRRAQLVDGRYGAIAVIEWTRAAPLAKPQAADGPREAPMRWTAPGRFTILLPALTIRSGEEGEAYRVLWGKREIGRGRTRRRGMPIRGPGAFAFRLVRPNAALAGADGWGWPEAHPADFAADPGASVAVGPAVLPGNRPVLKEPGPDFMTLDLTDYLRAGLSEAGVLEKEDAARFVPEKYGITLRYAAFAGYYGVGVTRPPPWKKPPTGRRHLLNLMLVLERIE